MGPDASKWNVDEADAPTDPKPSVLSADTVFGVLTGLLMGAAVGWACCWLVGEDDSEWPGSVIGALLGSTGGVVLGHRQSKSRRDPVRSELGTTICVVYPLLPGLLILLGGLGIVRGKFTGLLVLGAACAGPMLGLLVGGLLDRLYEGFLRQRQN